MEEVDEGCLMIGMAVSGWMFLLVPAYPGSPRQRAVRRLLLLLYVLALYMRNRKLPVHGLEYAKNLGLIWNIVTFNSWKRNILKHGMKQNLVVIFKNIKLFSLYA